MKTYNKIIFFTLAACLIAIGLVKAGYFCGPNDSLYMETRSGWKWLEATLSNDSAQHYKRVYVQSGNNGSYSWWVKPEDHSVTHKENAGLFDKDYAFANPCWKLSPNGEMICRIKSIPEA